MFILFFIFTLVIKKIKTDLQLLMMVEFAFPVFFLSENLYY